VTLVSPLGRVGVDLAPGPLGQSEHTWMTHQMPFNAATLGKTQDEWTAILSNVTEM
jgi:hypothetical protein